MGFYSRVTSILLPTAFVLGVSAVRTDGQLCNFTPLLPNQLCCGHALPVNLTSPEHDSCCLNPATLQGTTFNSALRFCNVETGEVLDIPDFGPLFQEPSNSIDNVPSSDYYDDGPGSMLDTLDVDRWCLPRAGLGNEVSPRSQSSGREEGEARCCGDQPYLPTQHTCCSGLLFNNTAEEMMCCYDRAYARGDASNPCLGVCGGSEYNSETELCCDGVVRPSTSHSEMCCGTAKIDSRQHTCCGDGAAVLPVKSRHVRCCADRVPYIARYMQCRARGAVRRKAGKKFRATLLCGRLPNWGASWPSLHLLQGPRTPQPLAHVEGRVTQVSRDAHQPSTAILTLRSHQVQPAGLLAQDPRLLNSTCSRDVHRVRLQVHLGRAGSRKKCRGRQLLRYLRGRVLQVFFPLNAFSCDEGDFVVSFPERSREHLVLLTSA